MHSSPMLSPTFADECDDVCPTTGFPSGTTLSNCTLTFTGTTSGIWYVISVQVNLVSPPLFHENSHFLGRRFHRYIKYDTIEFSSDSILSICDAEFNMFRITSYSSLDHLSRSSGGSISQYHPFCHE